MLKSQVLTNVSEEDQEQMVKEGFIVTDEYKYLGLGISYNMEHNIKRIKSKLQAMATSNKYQWALNTQYVATKAFAWSIGSYF